MAYAIIKPDLACTGSVRDHRSEFLIDSENDLVNIIEKVAPGSMAKMADGSKEFTMSPSGEWVEQITGEGGGSSSGSGSNTNNEPFIYDAPVFNEEDYQHIISSTEDYNKFYDAFTNNKCIYISKSDTCYPILKISFIEASGTEAVYVAYNPYIEYNSYDVEQRKYYMAHDGFWIYKE